MFISINLQKNLYVLKPSESAAACCPLGIMLSSFKHEAKQEVAEEAARDPNSRFSAEDAERVMVEESKKAGAPAFQFDPNASPEEKAAQARAVS